MKKLILAIFILFSFISFSEEDKIDSTCYNYYLRDSIISFANQFLGTPYKYGGESTTGFDCSGFVKYVFKKFGFELPHSSTMMANSGEEKQKDFAEMGDLIVFKGRSSSTVGHVGIVFQNYLNDLIFIHSSSPRSGGVIISKLSESYYKQRFIKVIDVLG